MHVVDGTVAPLAVEKLAAERAPPWAAARGKRRQHVRRRDLVEVDQVEAGKRVSRHRHRLMALVDLLEFTPGQVGDQVTPQHVGLTDDDGVAEAADHRDQAVVVLDGGGAADDDAGTLPADHAGEFQGPLELDGLGGDAYEVVGSEVVVPFQVLADLVDQVDLPVGRHHGGQVGQREGNQLRGPHLAFVQAVRGVDGGFDQQNTHGTPRVSGNHRAVRWLAVRVVRCTECQDVRSSGTATKRL